jgi:hypothetical protein
MAALVFFALLISSGDGILAVELAKANPIVPHTFVPCITINSNGTVTPETESIVRIGDTYTLTADIEEKSQQTPT